MKIHLIKTLQYDLYLDTCSKYESAYSSLSQIRDPKSTANASFCIPDDASLFYSKMDRVASTVQNNGGSKEMKELNEILIDLKNSISKKTFDLEGSNSVRKAFIQNFIHESNFRNLIKNDIGIIFSEINKLKVEEVYIVSHSFKVAVIEAYIKTEGEIFDNPNLIKNFIDEKKKSLGFGQFRTIDYLN